MATLHNTSRNGLRYRVVVTGIGLITPIGVGRERFWQNLRAGKIGVRRITRFDADEFSSQIAAEIDDFDPADFLSAKRRKWTDRFAQFSVAAARLALDDARFSVNGNGNEISVFVGSALGGLAYADEQYQLYQQQGIRGVHPLLAISVFGGASVSNIALEFGLSGHNVANANSCASGAVAIGQAFQAVARGDTRAALAGGVEAPLSPLIYGAFTVINAMSRRNADPPAASRPFDRERDGFVMAEGAGIFVLERLEDALRRDAHIYGEIVGFGLSNDAYHMSAPRPDGTQTARAMIEALEQASLAADEVEAINAHGSSTPLGDRTESLAYELAFGSDAGRIPVSATKGQHGHALGATGAWEVGIALMSMEHGVIPATANLTQTEDDCAIKPSADELQCRPRVVLSNSSGFGGINAALAIKSLAET
ncbi:MAG: beta-ketoacyl-[acyl-carrier-protein] synthase family protein [Candidatus Eremiobacteraeota bacterium]|nr:beta-ketoacyl-[acyl-carrier-protein] synthase family protein [Candidatus Eremiobacteraeota bacterium]